MNGEGCGGVQGGWWRHSCHSASPAGTSGLFVQTSLGQPCTRPVAPRAYASQREQSPGERALPGQGSVAVGGCVRQLCWVTNYPKRRGFQQQRPFLIAQNTGWQGDGADLARAGFGWTCSHPRSLSWDSWLPAIHASLRLRRPAGACSGSWQASRGANGSWGYLKAGLRIGPPPLPLHSLGAATRPARIPGTGRWLCLWVAVAGRGDICSHFLK